MFAIFTGKHLCWSLCLIKLKAQLFSYEYCKIFKNTYSEDCLRKVASEVKRKIAFGMISLFYVKI